jgi:hypothetical protein
MRPAPLVSCATLLLATAALLAPRPAAAEDRMPGEVAELTPEARTKTQAHVAAIVAGKEPAKAARAIVLLGPKVWPVVEETVRVTVADAPKPWFSYLRALLVPKAEPDFEALRVRLRRSVLVGRTDGILSDLLEFRRGLPDPERKGKRLPIGVPPQTLTGGGKAYRSGDGSIVVAFGAEGTTKEPDPPDLFLADAQAGFVAAVGGRGAPVEGAAGRGGSVTVNAENGFSFAWAGDGADGQKPDGQGGAGGVAEGQGGAGVHLRQGVAGKDVLPK